MSMCTQPRGNSTTDTHVSKEAHLRNPLRGVNLILRKPGDVFQGLLNIRTFEAGVLVQNFLECCAVGDLIDDQ